MWIVDLFIVAKFCVKQATLFLDELKAEKLPVHKLSEQQSPGFEFSLSF